MRLPVVLLICSCLSALGFCGAGAVNLESQTKQAATSSRMSVSLSIRVNQFTIGQDVPVTLKIKDISNQNISIRTAPSYYRVYIEDAKGEVEKTRFYHRLRGEFLPGESDLALGGVTLEILPGESETLEFGLARYYKLVEAGEYRVYIESDDEAGTPVRSNTVSFKLKTPN